MVARKISCRTGPQFVRYPRRVCKDATGTLPQNPPLYAIPVALSWLQLAQPQAFPSSWKRFAKSWGKEQGVLHSIQGQNPTDLICQGPLCTAPCTEWLSWAKAANSVTTNNLDAMVFENDVSRTSPWKAIDTKQTDPLKAWQKLKSSSGEISKHCCWLDPIC